MKAKGSGFDILASRILATKDPATQKTLGHSSRIEDDKWPCYETMKKGAIAKFSQNRRLWEFLKSTQGVELQHANAHDEDWGTGVALFDKHVLTKPFKGKNLLGKMLMDIRDSDLADPHKNSTQTGILSLPLPLVASSERSHNEASAVLRNSTDTCMDVTPAESQDIVDDMMAKAKELGLQPAPASANHS